MDFEEYPGEKVATIACGYYFTYFLLTNGSLVGFGQTNNEAHLLNSNLGYRHFEGLPPMRTISCGSNCTICVSDEYDLYVFGLGPSVSTTKNPGKLNITHNGKKLKFYNASCGYISPQIPEALFCF